MELKDLKNTIQNHTGEFLCAGIHDESKVKTVSFTHSFEDPSASTGLKNAGKIDDFYNTFGSLTLYSEPTSGESAFYIGRPDQWDSLYNDFYSWVDLLDEEEKSEILPTWFESYKVIGEIPETGNYILLSLHESALGHIFEFEHDGFEFIELGSDIESFILSVLNPDSEQLTNMASHMRFMESGSNQQWWMLQMSDNQGNIVKTED